MSESPCLVSTAEVGERSLEAEVESLFVSFDRDALVSIDRQLRQRDDESSSRHFEQMWKVVSLFLLRGLAPEALPLATKAVRCGRRVGDSVALRKSLNIRGEVHKRCGDLAHALEDYIEAYELASVIGRPLEKASTVSNLAGVPQELGLVDVAERLCLHALQLLDECNSSEEPVVTIKAIVLANLGGTTLWTNPARSAQFSDESMRVVSRLPRDSRASRLHLGELTVRVRVNRLIAAIQLGDDDQARRVCDALRFDERRQDNAQLALCIQTALGAHEAKFGDSAAGLLQLRRSVAETCLSVGDWIEAARLLVHTLDASGRNREAAETLALMHLRLQEVRRSIAVEELRRIDVDLPVESAERDLDRQIAQFAVAAEELSVRLSAKLSHLERIAVTAEIREGSEMSRAEHVYRVGKLCAGLAAEAGCTLEMQWLAEVAGRLHDIGKCAVPDSVIGAAPLEVAHRAIVRGHTEYGARLISDADEPRLVQVVAAVRHHHERVDGTGYPSGLRGEEIPLLARIVALSESFDAMLQSRAYRSSRTVTSALEEIERGAGTQFDSRLAGLFVGFVRRLMREYGDVQEYLGKQARAISPVRAFGSLERLTSQARARL